jgi:hypothetical protein
MRVAGQADGRVPEQFDTRATSVPDASSSDARPCRKSCNRILGGPAVAASWVNRLVTRSGGIGAVLAGEHQTVVDVQDRPRWNDKPTTLELQNRPRWNATNGGPPAACLLVTAAELWSGGRPLPPASLS